MLAENSARFADMWKQLQESAEVRPIPAKPAPPGGGESDQGTSLQQAAMALDQIALPSAVSVGQSQGSPRDIGVLPCGMRNDSGSKEVVSSETKETVDIGQAISEALHSVTLNGDRNNSCEISRSVEVRISVFF